jgi:hypothetical protein
MTQAPQPDALRLADALTIPECTLEHGDCMKAGELLRSQHARVLELEFRLEIDPSHPIDGISARDATIKLQDERIADLETQLSAIGAGGVEPLRKSPPAQAQEDAHDAARWRQVLRHVGGQRHPVCQTFGLVTLKPVSGNIMQGSVAEHFTKAIDAARAAQGGADHA